MSHLAETLGIKVDFFFSLLAAMLIFARVIMVVMLAPFMGTRAVPARVRTVMAFVITIFLYPILIEPLEGQVPQNLGVLFALFLKEMFFGFAIGFVTVMIFYALEAAGKIVDQQRGGANAMVFVPQLGQVTIFGLFNFWLAIAVFIIMGGHRQFLEAFFLSFQTVPLLEFPQLAPGFSPFLEFVVRLSGDVLVIATQIAAPVIIAILLIDIVLGIANKMAPQINVFELGFGIKGYSAPVMIYVALVILVSQMGHVTQDMIKQIYELSALFGR